MVRPSWSESQTCCCGKSGNSGVGYKSRIVVSVSVQVGLVKVRYNVCGTEAGK